MNKQNYITHWNDIVDDMNKILMNLWSKEKITMREYHNLFISMYSNGKYNDYLFNHRPISYTQSVETKKYMEKSQNNS